MELTASSTNRALPEQGHQPCISRTATASFREPRSSPSSRTPGRQPGRAPRSRADRSSIVGDGSSWTLSSLGVVHLRWSALAMHGPTLFAAFDLPTAAVIEFSPDEGQSWTFLEQQPGVLVYTLATHGDELYAGRGDGLWRRRSH